MKKIIFLTLTLVITNSFSQNTLNGIVLNYETKKPIEYVDIYNNYNFTSTNSEGRFSFISKNDSIKVRLIGYESINTTFKKIKNDTIFLKSKFEELDEIILSNTNPIIKIYKSVTNNYPSKPYSETFFLRCYIRKNGNLLKIQDLNGIVNRKTLFGTSENPMPKKNYTVNIQNVRKVGIYEEGVYFKMYNLKKILDEIGGIGLNIREYKFNENISKDKNLVKYSFSPKLKSSQKNEGYYLVNKNDNAFTEFHLKQVDTSSLYTKNRDIKFRTINYQKSIFFKKNINWNKYFIHKAKINAETEVIDKNGVKTIYDVKYLFVVLEQNKRKINKKHSLKKDIFKFKKPFNSEFWKKQEYLLLTKEMNDFVKKIKGSNNEFKTTTNMKE
ncbi:carboxypeptidase-like regulatory domain-containing protein [Tenacibaculum aiptasiae]|uniref:Carboxypeptidase-like regulatory domain-containing protein n=1 Tax=Tenacibaculum aiptasiae TaxID=426481 RepID=A0A7J5AC40_9FLAO|nr:carboxypeptidase-like regulatory domain-containing protein [Tenacibaculum aiptasiae]KAB1155136.1 carboxypeptidase-like regulatory domain-containing protein [Tenacibaculum aiptasiae]